MTYRVTLQLQNGNTAAVEVSATNQPDAEYRAACKAETLYGAVERVLKCNRKRD